LFLLVLAVIDLVQRDYSILRRVFWLRLGIPTLDKTSNFKGEEKLRLQRESVQQRIDLLSRKALGKRGTLGRRCGLAQAGLEPER